MIFEDIEPVLKLISKLPFNFDSYLFDHLLFPLFFDFLRIHDFFKLLFNFSNDVAAVESNLALKVAPELSDLRLIVSKEVSLLY